MWKGVCVSCCAPWAPPAPGAWGPGHPTKDLTQKLLNKASVKYSEHRLNVLAPTFQILADSETIKRGARGPIGEEPSNCWNQAFRCFHSSSYLVLFASFLFGTELRTGHGQHLTKTMISSWNVTGFWNTLSAPCVGGYFNPGGNKLCFMLSGHIAPSLRLRHLREDGNWTSCCLFEPKSPVCWATEPVNSLVSLFLISASPFAILVLFGE